MGDTASAEENKQLGQSSNEEVQEDLIQEDHPYQTSQPQKTEPEAQFIEKVETEDFVGESSAISAAENPI